MCEEEGVTQLSHLQLKLVANATKAEGVCVWEQGWVKERGEVYAEL